MKSVIKISLLAAIPLVFFCAFSFSVTTENTSTYSVGIIEVSASSTAATPTCTFSAFPSSISRGTNATLNWSTTNASSASINNGVGTVATGFSKSETVSPTNTTTYTLTVTGAGGPALQAACHPQPQLAP